MVIAMGQEKEVIQIGDSSDIPSVMLAIPSIIIS
jgi:hypothetical protein